MKGRILLTESLRHDSHLVQFAAQLPAASLQQLLADPASCPALSHTSLRPVFEALVPLVVGTLVDFLLARLPKLFELSLHVIDIRR